MTFWNKQAFFRCEPPAVNKAECMNFIAFKTAESVSNWNITFYPASCSMLQGGEISMILLAVLGNIKRLSRTKFENLYL